jgi:uncharacterized protein YbjT (DUF2867 family)
MITVMGATGQVGREITRLLLESGQTVRALGRSERKLAEIRNRGAEALAGDAGDSRFLTDAFRGADAVFTMIPSDPTDPAYRASAHRFGETILAAIRDSGVPDVVFLSSVGADIPSGTGYIAGLYDQEQRLRALAGSGITVRILRPGYFFENFYSSLPLIKEAGILGDSLAAAVQIPMIATRDIARSAAALLTAREENGRAVRELLGPRDLSMNEAAGIIGAAIGRPDVPYVPFSDEEMAAALGAAGFSD